MCFEQTVEPEPVVARLVARNDFHGLLHFSGNSRPNPLAQIQEPLPITGLQRVATDLVRQGCVDCNNPTFLAQFDCQKAPYGVIMGCGGRQVVYCPGFHQSLQCAGGEVDTDQMVLSAPRACIGSVSLVSINPEGSHNYPARNARALDPRSIFPTTARSMPGVDEDRRRSAQDPASWPRLGGMVLRPDFCRLQSHSKVGSAPDR